MKTIALIIVIALVTAIAGAWYFASTNSKDKAVSALVELGSDTVDGAKDKAIDVGTAALDVAKDALESAKDKAVDTIK